ncbi:MAG: DUF4920 domain-containing protein [Chiayiivirga sp.]|jgi:hypothetical protein|uniref:DUF4920 domain-containing protein n=1 Tax=Chiayiivirga sp. TaxID=2041042 RepID=UPI0025BF0E3F|nr:DUF4920 domain-containing protein [Chiayiivirga sp.]MCI1710456.1 DUF4920 domain-containing protein [Chiayiivirga sp.]MCI1728738.1 DUF4920 domain-containing protein [Chiayiivirga sp.]
MPKSILFALALFATSAAQAENAHHFGVEMPAGAALSIAAAKPDAKTATPQKYSGRIVEVCQKKGCWAMLEEGGVAARVMMKDYAFLLPTDRRGAAVVYGTLIEKQLDEKTARHLAEDAGREATNAPSSELRIEALAVDFVEG